MGKMSTKHEASFDAWFITLQELALHDYCLPLDDGDKTEFKPMYEQGLTQSEALAP